MLKVYRVKTYYNRIYAFTDIYSYYNPYADIRSLQILVLENGKLQFSVSQNQINFVLKNIQDRNATRPILVQIQRYK